MAYMNAGPIKTYEIDDKNKVDNYPHLVVKEIQHQGHAILIMGNPSII